MNVLVVADGHYYITKKGLVYADSVYDYKFYRRYLQAFDHVYAVIRAEVVSDVPKGKRLSSGDGVTFLRIPNFHGPFQYIKEYFKLVKYVKRYCRDYDCGIFRIPAATSNVFCKYFLKTKKPFAVEVVTDPWENFSPKATGNPIVLYFVRRVWTKTVKDMCQKANGAAYVTSNYLQMKYPPRASYDTTGKFFTASYSSVELEDDSFSNERIWKSGQKRYIVSHVANYFNDYGKGHLVLMNAVKIVRDRGYPLEIQFIGDGPKRKEFEDYARRLGILNITQFVGRLASGVEVRNMIRASDLFVLPTFAEGLPRALLEAMAEGLPCLSSPTCGVPEVLMSDYLFDFEDVNGFANGIITFLANADLMTREGKRNLEKAKEFSSSILNERRKTFYCNLRNLI